MSGSGKAVDKFIEAFGTRPEFVVRSPGRINLIGDHTDYNEGLVLPMAIDRSIWLAVAKRTDGMVRVFSSLKSGSCEFSVQSPDHHKGWCDYVAGVAHMLNEAGYQLSGWDGVIVSDLPAGTGLSSSAALELATARAFSQLSAIPWDPISMALVAHEAENDWVGVRCGTMDQLVVAMAEKNHGLKIDCRSIATTRVPIPASVAVVVLQTGTQRDLASSEYNERRRACEEAASSLGVAALRDVKVGVLEARKDRLDDEAFRLVRHVVNENAAVDAVARALEDGDCATAGRLMSSSHRSLRDDFRVSTLQLDSMYEAAVSSPGCFGARLTGAGFGGAVVSLVARDSLDEFTSKALDAYKRHTGQEGSVFPVTPVSGTSIEIDPTAAI